MAAESRGAGRVEEVALEPELSVRENGIGRLELRAPRRSSLPLGLAALEQVTRCLAEATELARRGDLRLLVITTARPHPDLVGYDLEELRGLDEAGLMAWSQAGQRVLRELEQLPVPTLAAIQGEWLGGAAELALACSYRVGSDAPAARIGFPQTRLGMVPAWGGTVRLPRLVGLLTALQLVVTGASMRMAEARGAGLLDRVLPTSDFALRVERYALRRLDRPLTRSRSSRPMRARLLDDTAPGRRLVVARAGRRFVREAGSGPAAEAALSLLAGSVTLPLEDAFARETEVASRLALSVDARGRLHSQRLTERARLRLPAAEGDFEATAVVGTGRTSSDLAFLFASGGSHVRLWGEQREAVRDAVGEALRRLEWEHQQGRISERQARRRSARIEGVTGFGGFGTLNLLAAVASEVGESPVELVRSLEGHVRPECVIAVHDWVAPAGAVQEALRVPERVVGIAPALPLERFPFLEIVPGAGTNEEAVSYVRRYARRLGLTPLVVGGAAPTPGTRLVAAYLAEGLRLLEEGAPLEEIDEAAVEFGFALGPFHRMDGIGGRRVHTMLSALAEVARGDFQPGAQLAEIARGAHTFYRYRAGRPTGPAHDAAARTHPISSETIVQRLVLRVIGEAVRILEEGGVAEAGDLELVSIHALGFPRERGGVLFHAHSLGATALVRELDAAAAAFGTRFAPTEFLIDLARTGGSFFGMEGRALDSE